MGEKLVFASWTISSADCAPWHTSRGMMSDQLSRFCASIRIRCYSLCDALSFVIMERLDIADAIAFDRHFREYGGLTIL